MIIYAADLHLSNIQPVNRKDSVEFASLYKLEYILKRARETGSKVIFGGDIFETPRPSYAFFNKLVSLFSKYTDVEVYSNIGNHDIEGANFKLEDTAIFTLFQSSLIRRIPSTESILIDGMSVQALDYTVTIPEGAEVLGSGIKKILVAHLPIIVKETPFYKHILTKNFKTNADLVLCGHIHERFLDKQGSTTYLSPSCIVRRKINEKDIAPAFYKITTDSIEEETIPLPYEAEFVKEISDQVISSVLGAIEEIKIENPKIEQAIYTSTFPNEVKEEAITRIRKAREMEETCLA
jgi:exonuclease SbcD